MPEQRLSISLTKFDDDHLGAMNENLRNIDDEIAKARIYTVTTNIAVDLSGSAVTQYIYHTEKACSIEKLTLLYIEGTSADAGITIEVGKESDRNYYYTGTTEISKSAYYTKDLTKENGVLLKTDITAGDTITFYSPGGKTGTGIIILILEYSYD